MICSDKSLYQVQSKYHSSCRVASKSLEKLNGALPHVPHISLCTYHQLLSEMFAQLPPVTSVVFMLKMQSRSVQTPVTPGSLLLDPCRGGEELGAVTPVRSLLPLERTCCVAQWESSRHEAEPKQWWKLSTLSYQGSVETRDYLCPTLRSQASPWGAPGARRISFS